MNPWKTPKNRGNPPKLTQLQRYWRFSSERWKILPFAEATAFVRKIPGKKRGKSPLRERGENSDSPGNLKASWIYISLLLPSLSSKTGNIFTQSKVIVSRDAWNPSCVKPFMCETLYVWNPLCVKAFMRVLLLIFFPNPFKDRSVNTKKALSILLKLFLPRDCNRHSSALTRANSLAPCMKLCVFLQARRSGGLQMH